MNERTLCFAFVLVYLVGASGSLAAMSSLEVTTQSACGRISVVRPKSNEVLTQEMVAGEWYYVIKRADDCEVVARVKGFTPCTSLIWLPNGNGFVAIEHLSGSFNIAAYENIGGSWKATRLEFPLLEYDRAQVTRLAYKKESVEVSGKFTKSGNATRRRESLDDYEYFTFKLHYLVKERRISDLVVNESTRKKFESTPALDIRLGSRIGGEGNEDKDIRDRRN